MKSRFVLLALLLIFALPVHAQIEMSGPHSIEANGGVDPTALDALVSAAQSLSSSAEAVRQAMEAMDDKLDGKAD